MIDAMSAFATLRQQLVEFSVTLKDWPWRETLGTLRQRFREDRLGLTASSLTFTTTIALVPLATVMFAIFTAFPVFGRFQESLQRYFIRSLVPDNIAKPVLSALTEFAQKAHSLGTVGLVLVGLTALALMLTIDRTLNNIWRVRRPRPMAQRVLVYWAAATLGPLLLGASLTLTSYAVSASTGLVAAMPGGISVVLNVLEVALLAAAAAGLFHYVPNTHVRWVHAWTGGLFVAIGFEVAKRALAYYLSQVPTYTTVYGAFATVPIFLIWLYCGWVIVLLGAVIAAYAPSLQMGIQRRPVTPGHRFELGLSVLRELAREREGPQHGLSLEALSRRLRTDPLLVEPILDMLLDLYWVGRLDEAGSPRYVLLARPAATPAQPLVDRLLLAHSPGVRDFWRHTRMTEHSLQDLLGGAA